MDWWHVALDIRSSSASSSSTGTTKSSSTKNSSTDLFAQDFAAAKAAAAQSKHTSSAPKPSSTAKSASASKPKPADSDGRSSSSAAAGKSSAAGQSRKSAAADAATHAHSGQDGSAPDDAAAANSDGSGTNGASGTNGTKGRATTRAAAPKTSASQSAAANTAGDAIDDPSADVSNQSGMSLLQLLAQSLQGDDSAEPTTDSATPATTDKSAADADTLSNDPNAIALAMLAQALAAAFGVSTATQQTPISNAAAAKAGDATAGITDATGSSDGAASMQDLMSVLAQNVAADAKSNSEPGASQFNVDPTKGSANDTSAADTAAAGPNSLAHLGVASHFSTQHLRNDTNMGELKSPVGSSAWDDELGTQLTWMTQKGLETGSLRVSPEHLGPVEVNISVRNGDASVWFGATHPDTRAALEQALPRLREMFASQGMNLTDSGVSRESPRNQGRPAASQSVSGVSAVGSSDVSTSAAVRMSLGLVDTYA
jgi:flagellar hook-length control protein FliK